MKELDLALQGWLARRWALAGEGERAAFEQLLDLPDPDLHGLLLGHASAPPELEGIVRELRGR
jgi:antitoxin CptB